MHFEYWCHVRAAGLIPDGKVNVAGASLTHALSMAVDYLAESLDRNQIQLFDIDGNLVTLHLKVFTHLK